MNDELLKYKIGIALIPGIGFITAKKLIAYVGSVEGVFKEKKSNLVKIPDIGSHLADNIVNHNVFDRVEEEIKFISQYNIKPFFYLDKDYPQRLINCYDAPLLLFAKGDVDFNQSKVISIVGTRNATERGRDICNELIKDLNDNGHNAIIVSGLAYGIDVVSHKAALKNNLKTIAVLGHGLDRIYPSSHTSIAKEIINQGALVTEFLSYTNPDRANFVKRNRIIAGLSDATIVIESAVKGGSLITADIANSYNRDVFAFPGRVNDKYSVGCNKFIKSNRAALIENFKDLEYILGWKAEEAKPKVIQKKLFVNLTDDEKIIIEFLKENDKQSIDNICLKTQFPMSKVSAMLLNLEFSGIIKSLPGKYYSLRS